ncbi:MAG TPA: hypothetical protein VFR89_04030, partial [candidate division Zixibacteria bacterium]|nr:hypothetical protein [candidate division Zixibacteria bacterium]
MKRFIFACAIFLAPASMTFGQETAPADTGAVQIPSQPGTATDTGTTSIPPSEQSPSDSAAIPPPGGTDTGTVVVPPVTPDTGAVAAPSDTSRPADTTAIPPAPPPQPREAEPVPSTPQPEAAPAETPGEEEVVGTPKPLNRFALGLVFNDEAPVAMRAWFNPKVGLDVGLGINLRQVVDERIIPQDP